MTLRTVVFNALAGDPALNALGIDVESLYPNHAPDSPAATQMRWAVLRWGVAEPSLGRDTTARPIAMSLWVYDREKDFGDIDAILKRARAVLLAMPLMATGDGSIIGVDWALSSEDLVDETYDAVVRSETYRVVASGI